jgi:hypothetical protein
MSEWTELPNAWQGASLYSLAARSHSGRSHDLIVQGEPGGMQKLESGSGNNAAFVDLGEAPLDSVGPREIALASELGKRLVEPAFKEDATVPADPDAASRAADNADSEFARELQALRANSSTDAVPGHTYALRVRRAHSHDLLVALHVAAIDRYGAVIAWRLVKSWPVPAPR